MKFAYFGTLFIITSCAGPYHPFGSNYSVSKISNDLFKKSKQHKAGQDLDSKNIIFSPKYQVLHESRNFSIEIKRNETSSEEKIYFFYNNVDITDQVEAISNVDRTSTKIIYTIANLTLPPVESHNFSVIYKSSPEAAPIGKTYPFPDCDIQDNPLLSAAKIKARRSVKNALKKIAEETELNSALMAGLIEQESSFNPKAVSWAKAVGLTQITPVAEKQLLENKEYYAYPKWGRLPASVLKTYIETGKINKDNDWKLDPIQSIKGGFDYLEYISNYWKKPQNIEAFPEQIKNNDEELTSIILASYNSGPSRVKRNLLKRGMYWLEARELKEARKYVYKVKSYCRQYAIERD
ncbi:lytic transglycosylase domain-containing protein [Halobacteriovorax sp.]|uniref:lytic transglycosylase domain-containing protein n=1 Tax=Halobacteriovorax sp. TaxID=2020862 RepID=UPI003566B6A0